jgi:hypothetical protein
MPKTADERIESMDRSIRNYRILVIALFVLLIITQRHRIVGWIDSVDGWMSNVARVSAAPVN